MQEQEPPSLEQIRALLEAIQEMRFEGERREEIYAWVDGTLRRHDYPRQGRATKGLLRRWVAKMTGMSRAQVTRLIHRYSGGEPVQLTVYRRLRFARRFTPADIALLVAVAQAHGTLSGPATRKILEREFKLFGHREYGAAGDDLRRASVQSTPQQWLPAPAHRVSGNSLDCGSQSSHRGRILRAEGMDHGPRLVD